MARQERVVAPVGVGVETLRAVRTRARIASFQQRGAVVRRFPEPLAEQSAPRVLAVVTHVADESRPSELIVERLQRTLDGLLESLGHTRLELVLNTLPGRHVAAALPDYLSSRLVVRERHGVEPMFLGFEAQARVRRAGPRTSTGSSTSRTTSLLSDGLVLEKLAYFNSGAPPEALLLPHRYEFWNGRQDLHRSRVQDAPWTGPGTGSRCSRSRTGGSRSSRIRTAVVTACRGSSSAAGSTPGASWYGRVSYTAARESAATGCLAESFRLYKPHPSNLSFLEIRHWDTKYAELSAEIHDLEGTRGTVAEARRRLWRAAAAQPRPGAATCVRRNSVSMCTWFPPKLLGHDARVLVEERAVVDQGVAAGEQEHVDERVDDRGSRGGGVVGERVRVARPGGGYSDRRVTAFGSPARSSLIHSASVA